MECLVVKHHLNHCSEYLFSAPTFKTALCAAFSSFIRLSRSLSGTVFDGAKSSWEGADCLMNDSHLSFARPWAHHSVCLKINTANHDLQRKAQSSQSAGYLAPTLSDKGACTSASMADNLAVAMNVAVAIMPCKRLSYLWVAILDLPLPITYMLKKLSPLAIHAEP